MAAAELLTSIDAHLSQVVERMNVPRGERSSPAVPLNLITGAPGSSAPDEPPPSLTGTLSEDLLVHISTYLEKQDCLTLIQCCRPLHALGSFRKPLSEWRWRWRSLYLAPLRPLLYAWRWRAAFKAWKFRAHRRNAQIVISVEARRLIDGRPVPCREHANQEAPDAHVLYFKLRRRTKVVKLIRAWASRQGIPPADLSLFLRGRPIFKGDRGEEQCVPEDAIWKEEYNEAAKALAGLDELADVIDLPPTLRLLWAPSRGGFPFYMADGDVLQLCVDTHHIEMPDDNSDATEGPVEEVN